MLKPFVAVLEWAIVLVIVFHPVHKRLVQATGRRGLSSLLSCLLVILVVVLPLGVVMVAVANEITRVLPNLRSNPLT
jgi:predicted PurR-regulated permease PerM